MAKTDFHFYRSNSPFSLLLLRLSVVLCLIAFFPSESEAIPPGSTTLDYQYRLLGIDFQEGSSDSQPYSNYRLSFFQDSINWGNLSGFINWVDEPSYHRLGSWLVEYRDLYFNGAKLDCAVGDNIIHYMLIGDYPFRFSNLPDPDITLEGPRLRLSYDRGEVDVFGGNLVLLTGSYGTGVDYLDETLVGIRSRYSILPGLRLGAQFLWSERSDDGEETSYPMYRRNDVYDFSVEVEPWPGYKLLQGELSLSHYQKRENSDAQDKGWDYAVILGPYIRNSKLYLEANFRHIGSNYQPISRFYYSDQEGFFLSGQYWPWWFLSVFGSGDFYRNNLKDDPDLAAIDTKNAILGLQLGGTSLPLVTARYGITERKSRHDEPSRTDNRLQSYTGEITYSYWGWFPILRYQHYDYRDSATRTSEYNSDLYYLELRKTFGNGSYSWINGDWNRYWSRSADSVTNTYTVRLGTDYRPSPALDLRGEVTYSRSQDDLHLIDTERKGLLVSLNAYLPWNFSLYAEYGYAKVDEKAGGRDRDEHRLYLRLSQRFGWGERPATAKPVVSGQPPPGYGTILGLAFDDRNGNGIRDEGESVLSGMRLKLEDGSLATTDEEGKFSFLNVEMGEHTVTLDTKKVPIEYDFVGEPKRKLEVKRRGTSQTDFAFLLLGKMTGRVVEDANANGKSEEGEKGLADVLVIATSGEKTFLTYTDEDGNFQIENLRGGSYRLGLDLASLPEGGEITSKETLEAAVPVGGEVKDLGFLVHIKPRPVIKKIFGEPEAPQGQKPTGVEEEQPLVQPEPDSRKEEEQDLRPQEEQGIDSPRAPQEGEREPEILKQEGPPLEPEPGPVEEQREKEPATQDLLQESPQGPQEEGEDQKELKQEGTEDLPQREEQPEESGASSTHSPLTQLSIYLDFLPACV